MAFATCVAAVFAASGLLLLFLLEDSFIDRQLHAAGRTVAAPGQSVAALPAEFSVYPIERVPLDIHARLPFAKVGEPFEMRRADRRYVHVLLVDTAAKGRVAVVYDVTDHLTVTPRLVTGLAIVLGLTGVTLLAARLLSSAFAGRVARRATYLVDDLRRAADPQVLRDRAETEEILEFRQLLLMHAEVWASQLDAVENERQTLAYLGHELRTPLQSSQTSLALLQEQPGDAAALERLERALARLTRASRAALWLATDRAADLGTSAALLPLIRQLVDEMSPLAARCGQSIEVDVGTSLSAPGPAEIAETILANLLLNAIRHGGPGVIALHGGVSALTISNPLSSGTRDTGFGLGLEIVQRLADRIAWRIDSDVDSGTTTTHIHLPPTNTAG
jgi:signal transduction histidine kinase